MKTNPIDGADLVWVPAGPFIMGDGLDTAHDDPIHLVTVDGYWIYRNDVTVAQFRAFCDATERQMPDEPPWGWIDSYPMVDVTWDEAQAYARWAHAALPTEAQWEKAARGKDGRAYPWGNTWDPSRCVNSVGSPLTSPMPVGSFHNGASPYGVLDMAGNVWNWCADYYGVGFYGSGHNTNPTGPAFNTGALVVRGGSFSDADSADFRTAHRNGLNSPQITYVGFGFRCVVNGN